MIGGQAVAPGSFDGTLRFRSASGLREMPTWFESQDGAYLRATQKPDAVVQSNEWYITTDTLNVRCGPGTQDETAEAYYDNTALLAAHITIKKIGWMISDNDWAFVEYTSTFYYHNERHSSSPYFDQTLMVGSKHNTGKRYKQADSVAFENIDNSEATII